jgi:DNA-binding NtrC family response regulator
LDEDARNLLINYPWPGNVRELKNIAEQISVLSEQKSIGVREIERFLPKHSDRNLPMIIGNTGSPGNAEFMNERDILYKLFFDMKKDVTELKKMFLEMDANLPL